MNSRPDHPQRLCGVVELEIDYSRPLTELFTAPRFDSVVSEILDPSLYQMPRAGRYRVHARLFHAEPGATHDPDSVIAAMRANGLEPARVEHLLAFAATYPELQTGPSPITALGTRLRRPPNGKEVFLCLTSNHYPEYPSRELRTDDASREDFSWAMLAVDAADIDCVPAVDPGEAVRSSLFDVPPPDPRRRPVSGIGARDPGPRAWPGISVAFGWAVGRDPAWASFDDTVPGSLGTRYQALAFPAELADVGRLDSARVLAERLGASVLDLPVLLALLREVSGGSRTFGPILCVLPVPPPEPSVGSWAVYLLPHNDEPSVIVLLDVWPDRLEVPDIRFAAHPALAGYEPSQLVAYRIPVDLGLAACAGPIRNIVWRKLQSQERRLAERVQAALRGDPLPGLAAPGGTLRRLQVAMALNWAALALCFASSWSLA